MLQVTKNISLQGYVVIEGVQVVSLNATGNVDNGTVSRNQYISNQELYTANKKEIRKQITEFNKLADDLEDELSADE